MLRLLRRHVGWRPKVGFVGLARLVEGCRDAEIAELYRFHVTREQDVFGLEVLMDNLLLMEEGQGINYLLYNALHRADIFGEYTALFF